MNNHYVRNPLPAQTKTITPGYLVLFEEGGRGVLLPLPFPFFDLQYSARADEQLFTW